MSSSTPFELMEISITGNHTIVESFPDLHSAMDAGRRLIEDQAGHQPWFQSHFYVREIRNGYIESKTEIL